MAHNPLAVLSTADPVHVAATCAQLGLAVDEFRELQRQSTAAAEGAYCPYSNFPVGAAVLTRYGPGAVDGAVDGAEPDGVDGVAVGGAGGGAGGVRGGRIILGANVENASFPVGTCAERVALGRAVFEGHRDFKALAVMATAAPGDIPCSPCGMCRQFIREFCELNLPILMFSKNGSYIAVRLEVLLPLSFGPEALGSAASPASHPV